MTPDNLHPNGVAGGNGNPLEVLDDWLFWVGDGEDITPLAHCTERGLNVDLWTRPNVERDVRGKNLILVFHFLGEERKEEFEAYGLARSAGAARVHIWKPVGLGDYETPNLKALAKRYSLSEMLYWEEPWKHPNPLRNPDRKPGWNLTDLGNAERMASRYGPVLKYCRPWKKWLVWTGQKWERDELGKVNVMAKMTVRKIPEECAAETDIGEREKIARFARQSEASARLSAILNLVWNEPRIPILPASLDPDPWLLNCPNGTINLKTGRLQPHDRADLITRMSPVEFDPDATCPLWEVTLDRIFADNQELIGFIQRLFGLALTGDCSEQILPIFYGEGGNGKSTILNVILDIMGPDYAIMAPPGLLFAKQNESHPTDKATLFGMRLVVDLESAEGARLNEAVVKQLTGSDRISARRMHEDFWTFKPSHKLIIGTNPLPTIQETKNAIWRRLKLVPFTVEIPEAEQQTDLPSRLRDEFPGILAWCVRGCVDWVQNGLQTPPTVQVATAEYRAEEDTLTRFLEDECITGPSLRVKASTLYQRYRGTVERIGGVPPTQTAFGRAMAKKGFERQTSNGTWYLNIDLRSSSREDTSSNW